MKLNRQNKTSEVLHSFTLIELLVVIAIIGILISLIMPSLSKARRTVQKSVCLNNVKSLGIATQLFLVDGDSNQQIKPGYYPKYEWWQRDIDKQLGTKLDKNSKGWEKYSHGKYWQCPAPERPKWPTPLDPWKLSYGMNEFLNHPGNIPDQYKAAKSCPQDAIPAPSKTVLIGETWGKGSYDNHIKRNRLKVWHDTTINIVFIDGHAAGAEYVLVEADVAPYIWWQDRR
ncbi:MAG: type II secretion system protein [Lentisphaeraceae bacterium]|nr:type II secretion system protein [Lentisphaeraceae bacterium]